jgi:hypothetical protein
VRILQCYEKKLVRGKAPVFEAGRGSRIPTEKNITCIFWSLNLNR